VHRIHTLEHPGLSFLIVSDGSSGAKAAIDLGGQIARLAHARVTLIGCGLKGEGVQAHLQEARKQLGSGLAALDVQTSHEPADQAVAYAVEQQPYDLAVMGFSYPQDLALAEQLLQVGEHHLLLAPAVQNTPQRALICVASGEPGKDDVLFAGRLVRHLGADATLLSVLPPGSKDADLLRRTEHFLEGGVRSLSLLGVPAQTTIRSGLVSEEINAELVRGDYDLLVLGLPLPRPGGKISLAGVVGQIIANVPDRAILIVRSHYMGARTYPIVVRERELNYTDAAR
jgi:sulfate transport system ATP-binding protein